MIALELEYLVKKDLTDGICLSGGNLSHIKSLLKRKYVSKKDMRKALSDQERFLKKIQITKDEILRRINLK